MAHVTPTLKYDAHTRRLALPAQFLKSEAIAPGQPIWICAPSSSTRWFMTRARWETVTALNLLPGGPSAERSELNAAMEVPISTLGRLALPRPLAFAPKTGKLLLWWTLKGGILGLHWRDSGGLEAQPTSTERPQPSRPAPTIPPRGKGQEALPDGLALPEPVKLIPLGSILGYDPSVEPERYDDGLAESIALQGMMRPVVLHGSRPHRVLDGRERLYVAQALQMGEVPAIVLAPLRAKDVGALRYLLETCNDRWALAHQLRAVQRHHLNGASIIKLQSLLRKKERTVRRYLRVARDPGLIDRIAAGELSLLEAERLVGTHTK